MTRAWCPAAPTPPEQGFALTSGGDQSIYPGAAQTELYSINNQGDLIGRYILPGRNGQLGVVGYFEAMPGPESADALLMTTFLLILGLRKRRWFTASQAFLRQPGDVPGEIPQRCLANPTLLLFCYPQRSKNMWTNPHALNRRQALSLIGTAALAKDVNTDLAHIGSRVYSEEGVAMFLACENLPPARTAPNEAPAPSALNRKVASAFQRDARQWQHLHPDAPVADVAKILEVLADKDFSSGGREPSL